MDTETSVRIEDLRMKTLSMLEHPTDWIRWPILLMKRMGHTREKAGWGVIVDDGAMGLNPKEGVVIYHVNLFDNPPRFSEDWSKLPTTHFPDIASMLEAGWVVD